ncbi:hypothetical protein O3P69_011891 [Scylla paramamosain]|uniref:Secreted protein n=1 Tax=Scylla paramamosain TaxID=85552 RepID=A0AAW0S9N5_SCYPA
MQPRGPPCKVFILTILSCFNKHFSADRPTGSCQSAAARGKNQVLRSTRCPFTSQQVWAARKSHYKLEIHSLGHSWSRTQDSRGSHFNESFRQKIRGDFHF